MELDDWVQIGFAVLAWLAYAGARLQGLQRWPARLRGRRPEQRAKARAA